MSADPNVAAGGDYAATYDPDMDFDAWYTRATAERIRGWLRPGQRLLELGCATGLMTSLMLPAGVTIVGVDHSADYLARARHRNLEGATFVRSRLETFEPDGDLFDHVIATNVLHEVADPAGLLQRSDRWLAPGGLVHVSLQNPASIHRLVALAEGSIDDLCAVSARGRAYGTRRLWLADDIVAVAAEAGLEAIAIAGVMLKPYPNDIMAVLPEGVIEGLIRAADELPAHSAMNYFVFGRAGDC